MRGEGKELHEAACEADTALAHGMHEAADEDAERIFVSGCRLLNLIP